MDGTLRKKEIYSFFDELELCIMYTRGNIVQNCLTNRQLTKSFVLVLEYHGQLRKHSMSKKENFYPSLFSHLKLSMKYNGQSDDNNSLEVVVPQILTLLFNLCLTLFLFFSNFSLGSAWHSVAVFNTTIQLSLSSILSATRNTILVIQGTFHSSKEQ